MKKIMVLFLVAATSVCAFARPPHGGGPRPFAGAHRHHVSPPRHHHRPHHHHRHHHGHGFVSGLIGGMIGGAIVNTITTPNTTLVVQDPVVVQPSPVVVSSPVVVTPTPVVQTQNVWVEGRYVDQLQPNGTYVRVWCPGHYEQRTITVQ